MYSLRLVEGDLDPCPPLGSARDLDSDVSTVVSDTQGRPLDV